MNETRGITRRGVALAAAVLLALPAAALAQGMGMSGHHPAAGSARDSIGPGHGMMSGGMMGGMGSVALGPTPAYILAQKDALGLTDQQTARLDSLRTQAAEAWRSHYAVMQDVHQKMAELRQAEKPDLDRYQQLMQRMASAGAGMHVRIAKLGQAAEQVLTPDQRSKVRYGMSLMGQRGAMGSGGMMGRGSMMGGGMMGGGMHGPRAAGTMGPGRMTGPGSVGQGAPCGGGSPAQGR